MTKRTVQNWNKRGSCPGNRRRRKRRSLFDPYAAYVLKRWKEGCKKGSVLYREMKEMGYKGTGRQVYRFLKTLKQEPDELPVLSVLSRVSVRPGSRKRILLTGAAGGIGSTFFRAAASRYHFRLADRETSSFILAPTSEHASCALEVSDLQACQQACRDIDMVVHLAATTNPEADFYPSLLHTNICGTYNIFRAAKDQGCQRVIFASSAQVFAGYPDDVQAHPESPLSPMNMYGVSKCFGEAVASYFAHAEGLSSIVLRIGSYDVNADPSNWLRQEPNVRHLSGYVSERDLNQLLIRCIEAANVRFAIVHAISNNRFKRLDL